MSVLAADRVDFDSEEAVAEGYAERGWTDGLPIVPPTEGRVQAMLAAAGLDPSEVLGAVPTRKLTVTAEAAAINAVMAGCRPEYFPVVVAAVRAHLHPKGNCHSTTATVSGAAQVVVVNGPITGELGIHGGQACFGPGFRANATIGRALRLVIRNVCLAVPGGLDRASFSTPMRYSFCFAEDETSGWTPLHVQRGLADGESAVTVLSLMSMLRASSYSEDPAELVATIARTARREGVPHDEFLGTGRSLAIVVGPEHRRRFADAGWDKPTLQQRLWPLLTAPTTGAEDNTLDLAGPDNILVITAGGPGMAESWLITPHLSNPITERVV
ncbi:hypothetical protein GIS00_18585 [Nakamurella sp. YIM 132087]|uniref:Thioredoxin n=1 Tax=Nakamurella alba TaxID=2665158 RepID=A0A7K1FP67_9ACTN|nr:hypothetical protein [Nakamurella alba]MTD15946.1 hypothetical protein [Nakamurella alba]